MDVAVDNASTVDELMGIASQKEEELQEKKRLAKEKALTEAREQLRDLFGPDEVGGDVWAMLGIDPMQAEKNEEGLLCVEGKVKGMPIRFFNHNGSYFVQTWEETVEMIHERRVMGANGKPKRDAEGKVLLEQEVEKTPGVPSMPGEPGYSNTTAFDFGRVDSAEGWLKNKEILGRALLAFAKFHGI